MKFPNPIKNLQCSNEHKAESSCFEMVKNHFPLPCQSLPHPSTAQCQERLLWLTTSTLQEKQKSGACVPKFQLFRGQLRELVSFLPHSGSLANQHSLNAWGSLMAWCNWEKAHNLRLLYQEGRRGVQCVSVILALQGADRELVYFHAW